MDTLTTRLQQQTEGLDTSTLSPAETLPSVVRRGRRYMVSMAAATILGTTAAVATAAVAVPQLVEQLRGPETPVVLSTPEAEPVPEVVEEPAPPVDESVEEEAAPPVDAEEKGGADVAAADTVAPELVVLSPTDGSTVTAKEVLFTGEVEPGARVKAGPYEATVTEDGAWSIVLIAAKGTNDVTFTATDAAGNVSKATVTITYVPPAAEEKPVEETSEPKEEKPEPVKEEPVGEETFSASQQSSKLTGSPYTNAYWGTARPGEKIKVISDFGWNHAYADSSGNWEMVVTFEPPPGTKTFTVTARYYHDGSVARSFQLTTVAPEAAAFTASQAKSSVSASNPTNTYSGTGQPGHEVWIWTEAHGQWWTTVKGDGTWSMTVTYAEVAPGKVFEVKAKDLTSGAKKYFEVRITE